MKGYVYVLSNPSMPGIYKVGRSKNGGRARAADLHTTGVPTPFEVLTEVLVSDCVNTESLVHEALQDKRVSTSREFFQCDAAEVVEAVYEVAAQDWELGVVPAEMSDLSDFYLISSRINAHPFIVFALVHLVPEEEWKKAYEAWQIRYGVVPLNPEDKKAAEGAE